MILRWRADDTTLKIPCNVGKLTGVQGGVSHPNSACRSLLGAFFAVVLALTFSGWAWADDVTTLSGQTFRDVRLVRAEPDGVTWEHATGMVKVDFTDLPEPVRRAFHYDAGKAAAFVAAQTQAQAKSAAQAQQAKTDAETGEFVLRRKAAEAQAVDSVGEGIAARKAAEDFRTKDDGTIWDRRLWAIPKLIFGSNEFDGVVFNPKTDFNSHEFKATLHHSPGAEFAPDTAHDGFFQPVYMTKSYYDDVVRAEAFARGRP